MTLDKFRWLLSNYTSIQQDDANELISLQNRFPYSQVINNLVARAAQDLDLAEKNVLLHKSAVYSTDRSVLKAIMTAPRTIAFVAISAQKDDYKKDDVVKVISEDLDKDIPSFITIQRNEVIAINNSDIYRQVENDLAQLKVTKLHFLEVLEALETHKPTPLLNNSKINLVTKDSQAANDGLIEEIKSSKLKMKPEGPKQQEQIDIIDQFIKTQPTISKPKSISTPPATEDLSEKVDLYGDNIVSETLVEILLKQGKKEKAVEMLKKLIWKFPQKKAYFAAQIEGLKK